MICICESRPSNQDAMLIAVDRSPDSEDNLFINQIPSKRRFCGRVNRGLLNFRTMAIMTFSQKKRSLLMKAPFRQSLIILALSTATFCGPNSQCILSHYAISIVIFLTRFITCYGVWRQFLAIIHRKIEDYIDSYRPEKTTFYLDGMSGGRL